MFNQKKVRLSKVKHYDKATFSYILDNLLKVLFIKEKFQHFSEFFFIEPSLNFKFNCMQFLPLEAKLHTI